MDEKLIYRILTMVQDKDPLFMLLDRAVVWILLEKKWVYISRKDFDMDDASLTIDGQEKIKKLEISLLKT